MTLDYTEVGPIKVRIIDYIDEIIDESDKAQTRGRGIKTSAAPEDLYKVDEDCENLSPDKANIFHNLVAKTLYITNQASTDTHTAVELTTTRVSEPTKYDWGKLFHIMKYIRGTRDLIFIPSLNGSGVLKWCIDEYYEVHSNMRVHNGGGISMGRGFPIVIYQEEAKHPQLN